MKRILTIGATAILTGVLTLWGYKTFFEQPQVTIIQQDSNASLARMTSNLPGAAFDFVSAAEFALPTVVHVKTEVQAQRRPMNPIEEFFFGPRMQQPQIQMGTGSGVVVTSDGYIITNNHVVANASGIEVVLHDGKELRAKIVGVDPATDLALIKVDYDNLQPAVFANSDEISVGEWVLALGNPFNLTNTVTHGIVSAKGRSINIINDRTAIEAFIQTDAAVNPGNSGGALVNVKGELVGINTAISSRSGSFEGYSFAVPSNIVQKILEDILEFGVVQRAFIGVNISDISPEKVRELKLENRNGAFVAGLAPNGAAAEAGIEEGDVIVSVDGRIIRRSSELQESIGRKRPGDKVKIEVIRKGKKQNFEVILRNQEGTTDVVEKDMIASTAGLGASFEPITNDERRELGINGGLKVTEVRQGKLARANVPKDFIITHVNRRPVKSVEDLNQILGSLKSGDGVMIEGLFPNGRPGYFAFGW